MKVYQLAAYGFRVHLDGLGRIYSKRVFRSKEAAEAYVEHFKTKCRNSEPSAKSLSDIDVTRVEILELELEEEN